MVKIPTSLIISAPFIAIILSPYYLYQYIKYKWDQSLKQTIKED